MAFSIQTNVNALVAQQNLNVNSTFQSQTIQRLTSGYRINQSGDDAAGLAVANKYRSDTAELAQGMRNANDGVSQLQIMDGGMNNISKMLDRLKTLATQAASGTFTGDRTVLNGEYQTLTQEIDRQAQSIGLATGGRFAQSMGVYIGGGTTNAGTVDTSNGTVNLNLANSVVDTKGLGLRTTNFQVGTASGTDIGAGSTTSIATIAQNANNSGTMASFTVSGSGFSNIAISADISGMTDPAQVASKLNDSISLAGNTGTAQSVAFRQAGITASVATDSSGKQSLVFSANGASFQVSAGSKTASALLGNFSKAVGATAGQGVDPAETVTGATAVASAAPAAETVLLKFVINGTATTATATIAGTEITANALLGDVTGAAGMPAGVTASLAGGKLQLTGPAGQSMQVEVSGDSANYLGMGSWQGGFGTHSFDAAAGAGYAAGSAVMELSLAGGDKVSITVNTATATTVAASINNAVAQNATLQAAGISASDSLGANGFQIKSTNNTNFRYNIASRTAGGFDLGLNGTVDGVGTSSLGNLNGVTASSTRVDAVGSSKTGVGPNQDVFSFSGLRNTGDAQTLSFSTVDATGATQSVSVSMTAANSSNLDAALTTINGILQGNNALKNVVAVKEQNAAGTAEGIRFISSQSSFSVKLGNATNFTDANPVGIYDGTANPAAKQGVTVNSTEGGVADISTMAGATQAVVTLTAAVGKLGTAQAAVGKGQNQLGYAINLAQSQITNFSAAESRIRDADVASEAANLTKAQVLQQASMAAMAQANSAPQAVLALLRG